MIVWHRRLYDSIAFGQANNATEIDLVTNFLLKKLGAYLGGASTSMGRGNMILGYNIPRNTQLILQILCICKIYAFMCSFVLDQIDF